MKTSKKSHWVKRGSSRAGGNQADKPPLPWPVGAVLLGDHVGRRALVDVQLRRRAPAIAGTTWIVLAPVPITATRLPFRSTSWSQRAVWKIGSLESVGSRDPGQRGAAELAACGDQYVRLDRLAGRRLDPPAAGLSSNSARAPRCRGAGSVRGRTSSRSARGSRGSPAAASSGGSSPDSARTRTSRGATGRRRPRPDRCCRARLRRPLRLLEDRERVDPAPSSA